jgi:hypothetical protein
MPVETGETMSSLVAQPIGTVHLGFIADDRKKRVCDNLSAVAIHGDELWFGTDEDTLLDCLSKVADGGYAGHKTFQLKDTLTLPDRDGKKDEVDIEGLDVVGDQLWLVGSHAVTRDKPDPEADGAKQAIKDLTDLKEGPNRWTLAVWALPKDKENRPALGRAAQLAATAESSPLRALLADDPHLGPFLALPAKENGFDIEGLAVTKDERLFLGLRGPVLRGWAVLLELKVEIAGHALELQPNGPSGRRYRKHFLDLEGGGVRDLCFADDSSQTLLILAGPTMALDGAVRVHRWAPPNAAAEDSITVLTKCAAIMEIPHQRGRDRAEGIAVRQGQHGAELLVVYDTPADARAPKGQHGVAADLFALPG